MQQNVPGWTQTTDIVLTVNVLDRELRGRPIVTNKCPRFLSEIINSYMLCGCNVLVSTCTVCIDIHM